MTFWNPTEEEVQHAAILILTKTIQLVTEKGMNPVDACKQAPKEIWPNPRIEVAKRGAAHAVSMLYIRYSTYQIGDSVPP